MEGDLSYEDFDLLIESGPAGNYRARVLRSAVGESAAVQFMLPFTPLEIENFVLKVGLVRRGTRGPGRPKSAPLKDFGGRLFGAVFQDEVREVLLGSLGHARAQGVGMRLRLRLADAPELATLPWEFLYDPRHNRFLAQSRRTPLVRYLDLPDAPDPLPVDGPLRLLVIISSPSGYQPLDVEHEWTVLTRALAQPQSEGRVVVERLAAKMTTLQERLRRESFHAFHYVGHGFYRPEWGDGVLVMEDRNGHPHEVPGEQLGGLLSEYDSTRLAVLNACEGARSGASDPFSGVAQSLIQQGLPAVVAMQFEITDAAAITFAHGFYGAIADGYPLETALAEARRAILNEGNPIEWGTPVLYSRAPDGRLFRATGLSWTHDSDQSPAEKDHKAPEDPHREPWTRPARQGDAQHAQAAGALFSSPSTSRVIQVGPMTGNRRMALSRDGSQLLLISHDLTIWRKRAWNIKIWDTGTGTLVRELQTTGAAVTAAALDANGVRLAIGSEDHSARIWDATTGQEKLILSHSLITGRLAVITSYNSVDVVTFSPDGALLATCLDKTARIWDAATGEEKLRLTHGYPNLAAALTEEPRVKVAAFSPDGNRLATGGDDKTARIWAVSTGQQQLKVSHKESVKCVAFSPDGIRLATGGFDHTARIWDAASGERQLQLSHDGTVSAVVFSPDGTRLATQEGGTVWTWDAITGARQLEISTGYGEFSSDGSRLAVYHQEAVQVWDIFGQ